MAKAVKAKSPESKKSNPTQDVFNNIITRAGIGLPNHITGTEYPLVRWTQNWQLLTSLYRNNWIARRIVDVVAKDMLKNWIKFRSEMDPKQLEKLNKTVKETRLKHSLQQCLKDARLYGGSAGILIIEGQEDKLDEPLDINAILPGDFKGIYPVNRWSGINPDLTDLVTDASNPDFGRPRMYRFMEGTASNSGSTLLGQDRSGLYVHHSRVLTFHGDSLPYWEMQYESFWGASCLEAPMEELFKRDNTSANLAGLIFISNLLIFKLKSLDEILALGTQEMQDALQNSLQAQNQLRNNFSVQAVGAEDDVSNVSASFGGLSDIYELMMLDVSGAVGIPATKLYGRAPQGMNSTGEFDERNYNNMVEQEQEDKLSPVLDKLLPIMAISTYGDMPDDLTYDYNPVSTPSDKETADIVKSKVESIVSVAQAGLVSDQLAMKELRQMSESTGMFTNITDADINKASDESMYKISNEENPLEGNSDTNKD